MRCLYCDRTADYEARTDGVTVGLCSQHLKTEMDQLAEREPIATIRNALDA